MQTITEVRVLDDNNQVRFSVTETSFQPVTPNTALSEFRTATARITGRLIRQLEARYGAFTG